MRHISINNTLSAHIADQDLAEKCKITYELLAFDADENDYIGVYDWIENLAGVAATSDKDFWSMVNFDSSTGNLDMELWNKDIADLLDRFSDNGEISVKFEVRARIPGSDV
jgi:hypothetical protein